MKIAFDSQIFAAQTYGGVSRYFCEIANRIATYPDADVHVVAPLHVNAYINNVSKEIVRGSHTPYFTQSNILQRTASQLISSNMLNGLKPDILHETYYAPFALGAKKSTRVLTIYDMIHERLAPKNVPMHRVTRYKKNAADRADHIICISESTKRDVIEILGVPPEKISVIYLGFDLMTPSESYSLEKSQLLQEPYLLYVGKRDGYKNFMNLVEAYGASEFLRNNFKLVCFGGGGFKKHELELFKKLAIDDGRIVNYGGSDQFLSGLYRRASAFIYPSLYEGFGIPPLEAMAHDCPVICSKSSSIPEVVGLAGEYFDPSDIESMRLAIETVTESDIYRLSLIQKGRNRLGMFSWDRCAFETYNTYKELL